ncbi:MAG: peptidoglycan DD-metalloendopeptidase family protein [Proteobacteria bacterium]|nr:peptidoglycan DD-metalloendopeptidase family protein [Pseudomonadota bacterium]
MNSLDKSLNRRCFIKHTAQATAGLALMIGGIGGVATCEAAANPGKQYKWSGDFDIKKFDRWFMKNRLYNAGNPNLKKFHASQSEYRFKASLAKKWKPGIGYTVPMGEIMVASAPGQVHQIKEMPVVHKGKASGLMVTLAHPGRGRLYFSYYAHLGSAVVQEGQEVNRGDPIGYVKRYRGLEVKESLRFAKLMLFHDDSWVDPDNYGLNHGYMTYQSDHQGIGEFSGIEMDKRCRNQLAIHNELSKLSGIETFHWHKKESRCSWSRVERFRFLECLYETNPELFPNLSKNEFQTKKKEFYDNQPIIMTLPFRGPES